MKTIATKLFTLTFSLEAQACKDYRFVIKTLLLTTIYLLITISLSAQSNYKEAIQQGDAELQKSHFEMAMLKYLAADAFNIKNDPDKKTEVQQRIKKAFKKIEALKTQAENDKKQALAEKQNALNEKRKADSALAVAKKLVDAFYFYDGKFALAFNSMFYFIDKQGNEVSKLGQWVKAEQIDWRGFAKVKKYASDKSYYLIDSTGATYLLAEKLADLTPETQALDLTGKQLKSSQFFKDSTYASIFSYNNLRILFLNDNSIETIPPQINELQNLTYLDLGSNQLMSLPEEICELKNLF